MIGIGCMVALLALAIVPSASATVTCVGPDPTVTVCHDDDESSYYWGWVCTRLPNQPEHCTYILR
jgi:hypothetical protein